MRIIKQLAKDMECNIREAEEKIGTAYSLRTEFPAEAAWYRDMAKAHLDFNTKAHDMVAKQIAEYRDSDAYHDHPEYADGMMAVWNDQHTDMIAKTARIRAMIDTFK